MRTFVIAVSAAAATMLAFGATAKEEKAKKPVVKVFVGKLAKVDTEKKAIFVSEIPKKKDAEGKTYEIGYGDDVKVSVEKLSVALSDLPADTEVAVKYEESDGATKAQTVAVKNATKGKGFGVCTAVDDTSQTIKVNIKKGKEENEVMLRVSPDSAIFAGKKKAVLKAAGIGEDVFVEWVTVGTGNWVIKLTVQQKKKK